MNEYLDEDGYPTEEALDKIEKWHYNDPRGWFKFIENIWHLRSWGWTEGYFKENESDPSDKYQYHISTAGWSGNEDIIRAMQVNNILWSDAWVESRRGGHYIFEVEDEN
jgi:hypothetical protein